MQLLGGYLCTGDHLYTITRHFQTRKHRFHSLCDLQNSHINRLLIQVLLLTSRRKTFNKHFLHVFFLKCWISGWHVEKQADDKDDYSHTCCRFPPWHRRELSTEETAPKHQRCQSSSAKFNSKHLYTRKDSLSDRGNIFWYHKYL